MALTHARYGESIDIRPLGSRLTDEKTIALFKSQELELIRLVLPAGKHLPLHKVPGEITIQCLEGALLITAGESRHELHAGQLLYLPGGVMHGVAALQDASALVTVVLRR